VKPLAVLVLAAGLGKRMGSDLPKVLHQAGECSLVEHVLRTAAALNPQKIVVITGHKRELVEQVVEAGAGPQSYPKEVVEFAWQREQNGTGDAVRAALPNLEGFQGCVLVLCGDVPLVRLETLKKLIHCYTLEERQLVFLSFTGSSTDAYGRVLRGSTEGPTAIREFRDCTPEEQAVTEMNGGVYAVESEFLRAAVKRLSSTNAQGEYYLTDLVEDASNSELSVKAVQLPDPMELQGVNTPRELQQIDALLKKEGK